MPWRETEDTPDAESQSSTVWDACDMVHNSHKRLRLEGRETGVRREMAGLRGNAEHHCRDAHTMPLVTATQLSWCEVHLGCGGSHDFDLRGSEEVPIKVMCGS